MSADFMIDDYLADRYKIHHRIGRGTFGDVKLATDLKTNEKKAVKIMQIVNIDKYADDNDKENEENIRKLKNEVVVMSKLNHSNVLKFYESFQIANFYCIVSEYCNGNLTNSLLNHKKKGTRPKDNYNLFIDWLYQLSQGVKYLHDNNIIHRDIKPENILFKDDEIKVADFGESREIMHTLTSATVRGTPPYMSPEMIREETINKKTDIWSLGCVFYEIYYLKQAFSGKTQKELKDNIFNRRIEYLDSEKNDATDLINNMIKIDQTKRFSMNDVLSHKLFEDYIEAQEAHLRVDIPKLVALCNTVDDNYNLIERLIQRDHANFNYQDENGSTALMKASENGRSDVVELLLKKKVIVDAKDSNGCTALMFASQNGYDNIAELLIKKQAKVNERDNEDWTALTWASLKGHKNVVKLLIQSKADLNKKDKFGSTALMWASRNGHKDVVETLIQNRAGVNEKNSYGSTALMLASLNGHSAIVKLLVENNARVNEKTDLQFTALMFASNNNETDVVKYLKSKGATE